MSAFIFLLWLVVFLGTLVSALTSDFKDNLGGPMMGLVGVLVVVLSVGLTRCEMRDRSDR